MESTTLKGLNPLLISTIQPFQGCDAIGGDDPG